MVAEAAAHKNITSHFLFFCADDCLKRLPCASVQSKHSALILFEF